MKILEVKNLSASYGTVKALVDVSFFVEEGEIVAFIGPNGAGKSTALYSVCNLLPLRGGKIEKGEILFNGENIKGLQTSQLVRKGLCLVPEGRRIFPTMSVFENLEMGGFTITGNQGSVIKKRMEEVFELFPILKERKNQKAGTLSSGEQQMLAIARALMLKPKLLLLDEPSVGLSPNYVEIVFEKLEKINKEGISILLVEQNAQKALELCHRAYVFEFGKISFEGKRDSLITDEKIKKVFLGT
jgi:branched-chain amino acid transport system ATP-binding protein